VLVIRGQGSLQRTWPAEPLKPRRDVGVIQVRMVAAAGADELKHAGVAAFGAAVKDADRLVPDERRPAVADLTGKRECHVAIGLYAQPRVTAIVRARYGDGAWTDSRTGTSHGVRCLGTAHLLTASRLTHRQGGEFLPLPGSRAAASLLTAR
jgi:hypothetical protein